MMHATVKPLIAAFLIFSFFSCTLSKNKAVKHRTVYLLSGGFTAAHGHHTITLTERSAKVDTSFYPANDGFIYFIDSAYIKKNLHPSIDIETPLKVKPIYQLLMTLSHKSLKEYAAASQKIDSAYFVQEIIITENQNMDTLSFHIPAKTKEGGSQLDQFLYGLGHIFPFDGCRSSYKTFYLRQ